ncbi:DUF4175 family protein [Flavobacterium humi]|uniref:DUF4175 family protein n=1 Tax=Flavobacterium humi TaxID=2562683 RepID=A0A4Z0L8L0_9FLAO|nr:DUF4175 family protein [Flavobacterium humi]TGD58640.1 hypothetical protein E4635_06920 [Flavobacterium humi]
MENSKLIFQKLEGFIRKFYTNELLRGSIFFVGLGLIYLLATSFIEYFLWLKPIGRTFLFWLFLIVEIFLLVRFIAFPLFKLFKLQKGIGFNEASKIIGNHFSEVNDKLTNFLQLSQDGNHSELLLASIEQKANSLQPIPFTNAVDFNKNKKFLPLAIIPILVLLFLMLSGKEQLITESMNRVVHYKEQFLPPAPFRFVIGNDLKTEQGKDFTLTVKTVGNVVPEKAMIFIGDESYFMENTQQGMFRFVFEKPLENVDFHIEANEVVSKEYALDVVAVPAISNFEMLLNFPNYLNRKPEIIKGTGNAIVPEGTKVTWKISTIATSGIHLIQDNSSFSFNHDGNEFKLSKNIIQNTDYQIFTSNKSVENYEKLNYAINIIKDQYPTVKATMAPDSLKGTKNYVLGQISDDYGFSKLQVVYYPKNKPTDVKRGTIAIKNDVYDQFVFAFPSNLNIDAGVSYEYYFEVFDNDALHHFKSTKSEAFSHRESTAEEKQEENLQQQNDNINSLEKSLNAQDKQMSDLEKLKNSNKEKNSLDYKEQQKINDFIKRQKQQDEMMKEFSEKIKDNLEQFKSNEKDPEKELLKERLEKSEKELEKNKKLLDELKELNDKLSQEELFEKIEKFQQKSKNQSKNLEQLVELTKRYYVEKKAEQIADKLDKLSDKQEALSDDKKENSAEKQNEINKEFDKIQEDLKELNKENKELKSPLDIPQDKEKEESIEKDMQNATDDLKKNQQDKASPKQKNAAKKMKQMGQAMQAEMEGGEQEQMEEDVKMLRQILDNLLEFSFSQEVLIKNFKSTSSVSSASFTKYLKAQQDLKTQFKHVDDSLFAMSLRNPKISEPVTNEIGKVYYNIDKSIENFTDNQIGRGTANQQFTLTSANNLANLLSDILNGMQMSLAGMSGGKPKPGQGQGMQLPDIIKKQEGLAKKMGEGKPKSGNEGKPGAKGDKPGQSKGDKPGSSGEGNDGEGDAKQVLDILKEQQQLRDALEKELQKNGMGGSGQNALDQMKQIEKQLINKGFSNDVIQKALNLKYELLKLEKAMQEQNQDTKRQSNTNKAQFTNGAPPLPQKLQDYLNSIEILNRQTLPLRSNFNRKVQEYFKGNDKL